MTAGHGLTGGRRENLFDTAAGLLFRCAEFEMNTTFKTAIMSSAPCVTRTATWLHGRVVFGGVVGIF